MSTIPLTQRREWQALTQHYEKIKDVHLRQLFASDAKRGERFAVEDAGLYLDYSKNRISDETVQLLLALAELGEDRDRARPNHGRVEAVDHEQHREQRIELVDEFGTGLLHASVARRTAALQRRSDVGRKRDLEIGARLLGRLEVQR